MYTILIYTHKYYFLIIAAAYMSFFCPWRQNTSSYEAVLHYINENSIKEMDRRIDICINEKYYELHNHDTFKPVKSLIETARSTTINPISIIRGQKVRKSLQNMRVSEKEQYQNISAIIQQQIRFKRTKIMRKDITFPALQTLISTENKVVKNRQRLVVKMVRKSQYHHLSKMLGAYKFTDQQFQRKQQFKLDNSMSKPIQLKWERLSQIPQYQNKIVFMQKIESMNINQGIIGDCYFLSSVAALTQIPFRVTQLFDDLKLQKSGLYMAKLVFKGILQEVIVDDYFPISTQTNRIIGCTISSSSNYEIYPLILQKCWAKLWGSFQKIDSGYPHQALHALTGAITKNYFLMEETKMLKEEAFVQGNNQMKDHTKSQLFFNQVANYGQVKYLLCTATGGQTQPKQIASNKQTKSLIIQNNHAYVIKHIKRQGEKKLVTLYNPWGFNRVVSKGMPHSNDFQKVQGQFTLQWSQYIESFKYLTACKIRDYAHYIFIQLENCKKHHFKFIELSIEQENQRTEGYFGICVSQTDRKQQKVSKCIGVTFLVVKIIENSDKYTIYEPIAGKTKTQYKFADHYLQLNGLTKGKYIVGCFFTEKQIKEVLTFSVYSEQVFGIKEINNINEKQFMNQNLRFYAKTKDQQKEILPQDQNVWMYYSIIPKTSLGYLITHVGRNAKHQKLIVQMSAKQFQQQGLKFYQPYSNSNVIHLQTERGQQGIIVFLVSDIAQYKVFDADFFHKNNKRLHQTIEISKKLID